MTTLLGFAFVYYFLIIVAYIGISIELGNVAERKNRSCFMWICFSIAFSPFIAGFFLLCMDQLPSKEDSKQTMRNSIEEQKRQFGTKKEETEDERNIREADERLKNK